MPVLNVGSKVPDLAGKRDSPVGETTFALNSAITDIAKRDGLNLSVRADYDTAWKNLRAEKPELFKQG
jgi:hypothetical protein